MSLHSFTLLLVELVKYFMCGHLMLYVIFEDNEAMPHVEAYYALNAAVTLSVITVILGTSYLL